MFDDVIDDVHMFDDVIDDVPRVSCPRRMMLLADAHHTIAYVYI